MIRPLLGPGWIRGKRPSDGGWTSSCGRGVGERRFLRVLVARSSQICSLREKQLRSVVGLRRFQPPDDSVPLHFHAHFCPLAWPGYSPISVAHGLIRALTLALFFRADEVGSVPPGQDGCAHLHDGTWRLSSRAGLPVLTGGVGRYAQPRSGGGIPPLGFSSFHLRICVTSQRGSRIRTPLVRAHRSLWGPLLVPTVPVHLGLDI